MKPLSISLRGRGNRFWLAVVLITLISGTVTPATALQPPPPSPSLHFGAPYTVTGDFLQPYGVAVDDTHGRLLVADTGNNRFKWAPIANLTGAYTFTDAGFVVNRSDPNALTDPQAVAADRAGNVYVVNTLVGNVVLFNWNAGTYGAGIVFCSSSPHVVAGLAISYPRDIAIGPDGSVYLLDSGNHRILRASGPTATAWSVFADDPSWADPYGLAVDQAGALYVADTGNHRIVKIAGTTTTAFGHWGTNAGEFRYPYDVSVDQHGRIFVADTFNHRIQVLDSNGHPMMQIGHAPAIGTLDKIVVDDADRIYAVDSDYNAVVVFLGAGTPVPFDFYLRDYLGDSGAEPSNGTFALSSPDILVRHQPDVDLLAAASTGLDQYAFEQPLYDENNYVYVAVHNRGASGVAGTTVKLYWADPCELLEFPLDWQTSGFYTSYISPTLSTGSNALQVPFIEGRQSATGTVVAWGYNHYGQTTVPAGLSEVKAIAAGQYHSLALKKDGTVIAWGDDREGQTSVPAGLSGVKAIAAGSLHNLALKEDGTVVAWGDSRYGQTTVPAGLSGVKAIAAGGGHNLALKEDGTVVAWGDNFYGQTTVPAGLSGVKAIVTGGGHSLALKEDGTVVAWGYNGYGQTTVPAGLSGVKAIAAGNNHSLALKEDGTVVAWGSNFYGQTTVPAGLSGVIAIAAGSAHSLALKGPSQSGNGLDHIRTNNNVALRRTQVTRTVVAWGDNREGQTTVPADLSGVKAIAAGRDQNLALKEDGTVIAWGYNGSGQATVPAGLRGVKAIAAGLSHNLALKEDGTVVAWGSNDYGETTVPAGLSGVKAIAARGFHNLALKEDGTVIAWGYNEDGQATVPAGLSGVKAIAAGISHSLALKEDGTVVAWGDNSFGQTTVPTGLNGVKAIAAGGFHSLALKEDGTVIAWGVNSLGQTTVPTGLSGVKAIAAGANHSLALKEDGTVIAWGYNGLGQTTVPADLSGVKAIAAGADYSLALTR